MRAPRNYSQIMNMPYCGKNSLQDGEDPYKALAEEIRYDGYAYQYRVLTTGETKTITEVYVPYNGKRELRRGDVDSLVNAAMHDPGITT